MSTQTPNYNLTKPLKTENYNIDVFNNNADIIDSALKSIDTQMNDIENNKLDKTAYISKKATLTLLNSWINEVGTLKVSREGNTIFVNGNIRSGVTTNDTILCTLDTDYRPSETKLLPVISSGTDYAYTIGYLLVYSNGQLTIGGDVKNTRTIINCSFTI